MREAKGVGKGGTSSASSAIDLLREDHDRLKLLFDEFEQTDEDKEKDRIADSVIAELNLHTAVEEEIFYPAIRRIISDEERVNRAEEAHEAAKALVAEIAEINSADDQFHAKFAVLIDHVRHHIEEEENEMFPDVEGGDVDLVSLGEEMIRRKQELPGGFSASSPVAKGIVKKRGKRL